MLGQSRRRVMVESRMSQGRLGTRLVVLEAIFNVVKQPSQAWRSFSSRHDTVPLLSLVVKIPFHDPVLQVVCMTADSQVGDCVFSLRHRNGMWLGLGLFHTCRTYPRLQVRYEDIALVTHNDNPAIDPVQSSASGSIWCGVQEGGGHDSSLNLGARFICEDLGAI